MKLKHGRLGFKGEEVEEFHAVESHCALGFLNCGGEKTSTE